MNNNWSTFQGNSARTGESKEIIIPPLKKAWEYKLDNQIATASPIVSNGIVYVGTKGIKEWSGALLALDTNSGKLLWKFESKGQILSTATIGNGMVYFRSESCVLYALDAISGEKKWEFKHGEVAWPGTSLLLTGNVICMTTDKLYLIDTRSGKCIWEEKSDRENSGASPALYEGILYLGFGTDVLAFDLKSQTKLWQTSLGSKTTAGPVISENVIYVGVMGYLIALDAATGEILWMQMIPQHPRGHNNNFFKSYPAVSQKMLYICAHNGMVYCLDGRTGKGSWSYDMEIYLYTSPIISGDHIYILSGEGVFCALNRFNGTKVWEYASTFDYPDIQSAAAICDGKIFVAWDKIYAFSN